MVRDDELNRLIRYGQGMGLSIRFKPYKRGSGIGAEWATDGSEIIVYVTSQGTKIEKILRLIHELSHNKAWIANDRKPDPKIEKALDLDEEGNSDKKNRKRILEMERADSEHWEQIYQDTNCKFNINKLYKQRELDIWMYEVYYEKGRDAKTKEIKAKKKELRKKYGC